MIEVGFFNRMKKLQPIRMLGSGMDLGELNDYAYEICFLLLQNIFQRELQENPHRTRNDMLILTESILSDLNLPTSKEIITRIVDGLLWYRDPNKQEAFEAQVYNEASRGKEAFLFRYLKVDREHSHWEQGGSTVYMLTEESQEMIFITREILEEFGFDIEQFYTLQLIKTGNFTKARTSIDHLMARVRVLIKREKDYRQDIIRDPQNIFIDRLIGGQKKKEAIEAQFAEEQEVFHNMLAWKSRYDSLPEDKKEEMEIMFDNLERARSLHNNLARFVMENLALEMEIRVKYPESFWQVTNYSFKKDIWQNHIVKNGLASMDDLELVITRLFSPQVEFIYPLEWAWAEQVQKVRRRIVKPLVDINEEEWDFRDTNWDLLVELYEDVFRALLEKGRFSILELNQIKPATREKWLAQRENIDLFMMLVISEFSLDFNNTGNDERLKLYSLLCEKNPEFKQLQNYKIGAFIETRGEALDWDELYISPYTIYVEE